jgi:hypothetical protein
MLMADYARFAAAMSLASCLRANRAVMEDPMHRLRQHHHGNPDPIAAAWIVCLTIAALGLVLSGIG